VSSRQLTALVAALVGAILLSWLLLVPPGGHPDEHSHLIRSGALVRGAEGDDGFYVMSDRYRVPEPGCYAFDPFTPATCVEPVTSTGDEVVLLTTADDYPPGGQFVFGVATLLPGLDPLWSARGVAALVATVIVTAALVAALQRDRLAAGALLFAVTPMAWATMPSVNPSAFAIAGAIGLWVAMLGIGDRAELTVGTTWLVTGGWAALALSRRDGLVWACIIVFVTCVFARVDLLDLARRLGAAALAVIGVSAAVTVAWGVTSDSRTSRLVAVAPVALVVAELARVRLRRAPDDARAGIWTIGAAGAIVAWLLLVSTRAGGWDTDLTVTIIGQTDDNLVEAIGRLGWLDAPLPAPVVFGWLIVLGALVAYASMNNRRAMYTAGIVAALAIVSSWTFELLQGNETGTYWQGRYSLPLVIGLPLLLAHPAAGAVPSVVESLAVRLTNWCTVGGLLFVNVAAWAAARRWGVGLDGTHRPWAWDTAIQPVPPILLLVLLAVASVALAWVVLRRRQAAPVA
jgi:hypothetical protein